MVVMGRGDTESDFSVEEGAMIVMGGGHRVTLMCRKVL